ncbi:hypothetical protein NCL_02006 [Burkholderia pseudomallei]
MKPSQFAKGFQARPDITTSEKRTALDRLNAIDGLVKSEAAAPAATPVNRRRRISPSQSSKRRPPRTQPTNPANIVRGESTIAISLAK